MKRILRSIISFSSSLLLMLCLFAASGLPAAGAQGTDPEPDDWDSIIAAFLSDNGCSEDSVALGYYNTVTGEEHYYRGDVYMETGSTYKVPLNMVYAERIYRGEMDFDTKIAGAEYEYLQYITIVRSNNEYATYLWQGLGEYGVFRDAIAGYMGVDPMTVEPEYYRNRLFTARQVVHCLTTLYSEPERFPGVIDCMLLAEPEEYFCHHPQDYPIAHKYGYISEGGSLCICDSGICYTDDPVIIVMFTENVRHPNSLLADYCTLMCNYAESTRQARLSKEESLAGITDAEPGSGAASYASGPVQAAAYEIPDAVTDNEEASPAPVIMLCVIGLAMSVPVIILAVKKKIRPLPGLLAAGFACAGIAVCIAGTVKGSVFTRTEGDPAETVCGFFDSILSGDYSSACTFLADYSDIGLDDIPEDPASAEMILALRASYDYETAGDCIIRGLSARQKVRIRYLDLSKMSSDLQKNTNACIHTLIESRYKDEIYDEAGEYRDEFISEAYAQAVDITLSSREDYYSYSLVDIDLIYRDGRWLMNSSPELFTALCGGV